MLTGKLTVRKIFYCCLINRGVRGTIFCNVFFLVMLAVFQCLGITVVCRGIAQSGLIVSRSVRWDEAVAALAIPLPLPMGCNPLPVVVSYGSRGFTRSRDALNMNSSSSAL